MKNIPCHLIQDLLPLYIDQVVSEETAQDVKEHLEQCENCRNEYQSLQQGLTEQDSPEIQDESAQVLRNMKCALQKQRIMAVMLAVLITIVVVFSAGIVVENVGPVHDFFDPCKCAEIRDSRTALWQVLPIRTDITDRETEEWLVYDSIFFEKRCINDANSSADMNIRVRDAAGNIVVEYRNVAHGTSCDLQMLKRNTKYRVEVQVHGTVFLNFV